jgi:D-beta-D-heptose 7-phosphate kinase/D-beta-D-heptose 1-phosphate adenosyltransferase
MARNVYDVTGAGDTVIATLAASIGAGADLESAARLANIAAGLVVEEVGTTIIKADSLKNALDGQ